MSRGSIDHAARTEELARDLAANFSRRTLAHYIARARMEPARHANYGNPALLTVTAAVFHDVQEFDAALDAAERTRAQEARQKRKFEAAERALAAAMREAS